MVDTLTDPLLLIWTPGVWELALILLIVLVIFGAGKIAGIGRGLGEGIRNFKQGLKGEDEKPDDGHTREKR